MPRSALRRYARSHIDGVRLDSPEWMRKGYVDDNGAPQHFLIPGNAEASTLYTLTVLPADHDDIMPGRGDPLSKAQTDLLKQWINQGADFGDFKAPEYVNPKSAAAQKQ